jgi:hypothetical protein
MAIEPFSWFQRFSAVWVVVVVVVVAICKWLFWWILESHNQKTLVAAPCRLLVQLLADKKPVLLAGSGSRLGFGGLRIGS